MQNSEGTHLIVRRDNLVSNFKVSVLEATGVHDIPVISLYVGDLKVSNTIDDDVARIVFLSTRLGIEAGLVEEDTEGRACRDILGGGNELLVVEDGLHVSSDVSDTVLGVVVGLGDRVVLFKSGQVVDIELHNVSGLLLGGTLASLLGVSLCLLELGLIDTQSQLLRHETGKIDRETKGVVQPPDVLAVELFDTSLGSAGGELVEELLAAVEGARERLFFLVQDLLDVVVLFGDLGEDISLQRKDVNGGT